MLLREDAKKPLQGATNSHSNHVRGVHSNTDAHSNVVTTPSSGGDENTPPSNVLSPRINRSVHNNRVLALSNRVNVSHGNNYAHGDNQSGVMLHHDNAETLNELYNKQLNMTPKKHAPPPGKWHQRRRQSCKY